MNIATVAKPLPNFKKRARIAISTTQKAIQSTKKARARLQGTFDFAAKGRGGVLADGFGLGAEVDEVGGVDGERGDVEVGAEGAHLFGVFCGDGGGVPGARRGGKDLETVGTAVDGALDGGPSAAGGGEVDTDAFAGWCHRSMVVPRALSWSTEQEGGSIVLGSEEEIVIRLGQQSAAPGRNATKRRTARLQAGARCRCLVSAVLWMCGVPGMRGALAQELNLNPTRPTVANSATVQGKGVLQVETGYDAYPQRVPGNQQTVDTALFYTPEAWLRLDFSWTGFAHESGDGETVNGVGTVQIGCKVVLKKEEYHRRMLGFGIQYEAELPTASQHALQGYGQQAIVLVNHHYGKNGDLDVIANGSVVQTDCRTAAGCSYGGQQSVALSYHVQKQTRIYAEVFGQNVSQSNTPPGTYVFGGFYHQFGEQFGIDGGMRFGVSDHSASVGTTVGLVFGRRLRGEGSAQGGVRP